MSKGLQFSCKKVTRLLQVHFFIGCRPSPPIVVLARKQRSWVLHQPFQTPFHKAKNLCAAAQRFFVLCFLSTILVFSHVFSVLKALTFFHKDISFIARIWYYNQ